MTASKQYSFWPGADGMDAWDVERLIGLSAELPVEEVDISTIGAVETVYWFNTPDDEPTVRGVADHARLINEVDLSYPIILGADGRVMDGMHRVAKAILGGHTTIKAVRFRVQPEPDYRNCKPDELAYRDPDPCVASSAARQRNSVRLGALACELPLASSGPASSRWRPRCRRRSGMIPRPTGRCAGPGTVCARADFPSNPTGHSTEKARPVETATTCFRASPPAQRCAVSSSTRCPG